MKMKSKFFGLNAKLALAVLAVGTMFTSCYDSENADVSKPYVAPDAMYTFTGTVVNNITGAGVGGATVALSGAVSGTVTTDDMGTYQFTTTVRDGVSGTVTLNVTGDDFDPAEATITVEKIANGQSIVYFKNVLVNYTEYLPEGLEIGTSNSTSSEDQVMQGEQEDEDNYVEELDIINNSNETMYVERTFVVSSGSKVYEDAENIMGLGVITRAVPEAAKEAIREWIIADLGSAPDAEFVTEERTQTISIPAGEALRSVTVSYTYETKTYNYSYGTETGSVSIQTILSVRFDSQTIGIAHYHGHGAGHGAGDNAGGGIIVPEV